MYKAYLKDGTTKFVPFEELFQYLEANREQIAPQQANVKPRRKSAVRN